MRASTSASHACGSTSLRRAVAMSVYMNAARSPPRSEPANSHDFLPRAMPLSARSAALRSEEHTSELQSLMRISYAVFCLKKKITKGKTSKKQQTIQNSRKLQYTIQAKRQNK